MTDVKATWAGKLGLSAPQLNMLVAISEADDEVGISVKSVAELLRVERTFVTAQSKILIARGLLQKRSSRADKRMVHLSLTPKARIQLASLAERAIAQSWSVNRRSNLALTHIRCS